VLRVTVACYSNSFFFNIEFNEKNENIQVPEDGLGFEKYKKTGKPEIKKKGRKI